MERPITALSWQVGVSARLGQVFPPSFRRLGPYIVALGWIGIAAAVRALFSLGIGVDVNPYLVFVVAVLGAALMGGVQVGLFTVAVSFLVGDLLFVSPVGRLAMDRKPLISGILFLVEGAAVAFVAGRLRSLLFEIMTTARWQAALAEIARAATTAPDERWLLRMAAESLSKEIDAPVEAWVREENDLVALHPDRVMPGTIDTTDAGPTATIEIDGARATHVSVIPGDAAPRGLLALRAPGRRSRSMEHLLDAAASIVGPALQKFRDTAALSESEERLRMAQAVANIGTWEWEFPTGKARWSESLEAIHGLAPGTFPGTFDAIRLYVHPDDLERVETSIVEAIDNGYYDVQYRVIAPDGLTRWVAARGRVFYGNDGKPLRAVGICMDITDQRVAEEALRRSEERLRLAQETGHLGTWELDTETEEVYWSEGAEQLHGLEPGTFARTYEASIAHVHPDDLPEVLHTAELLPRDGAREVEYRIVRPDGVIRWIRVSGRMLDARRAIGVHLDVTERRESEERLARSESRFREMANGVPALVWVAGTDGRMTFLNDQWLEFTGRPAEEGLGNGWLEDIHPDDREAAERIHHSSFDVRSPFEQELRLRNQQGQYCWMLERGRPLFHGEGSFAGYIGSCVDISDRRRAAEATRLLADVAADLSRSLDFGATLSRLARSVVPRFADWCCIALVQPDGVLTWGAMVHRSPDGEGSLAALEADTAGRVGGGGVYSRVVTSGEPVFTPEVRDGDIAGWARDERQAELLRTLGFGSGMCIPLRARGRIIGAMSFARTEGSDRYDGADLDLAMNLGHRAALAIDNATLYSESQQRAATIRRANDALQFLADAGIELSRSLQYEDRLIGVARLAVPRFADLCLVDTIEDGRLRRVGIAGADPELEAMAHQLAPWQLHDSGGDNAIMAAIHAGSTVFLPGTTPGELAAFVGDAPQRAVLESIAPRSVIVVPLVAGGRSLGVASLLRTGRRDPFTEDELAVAEQLGRRAGLSVDNARLYAEARRIEADLRRSNEVIGFLSDAGAEMAASLDYEESLKKLADLAVSRVSDWCAVDIVERGELHRVAVAHRNPEMAPLARELATRRLPGISGSGVVAQVIRTGRPELYREIDEDTAGSMFADPRVLEAIRRLQIRSAMVVPLENRTGVFGAITFVISEREHRFGRGDLAMAEELARRAAAAIENARLYTEAQERERELVRANEAKDEFLGMMSHELRTPITVIHGGARVLHTRGDQIDDEARLGIFSDIERESERLARMLENLLAMARVELDQEPVVEPVLIQRLVGRILAASRLSPDRDVQVTAAPALPPVAAEPAYLEHIIRNLVGNADKYSPPGLPIEVDLRGAPDGGVVVRVLDRGFGIGEDEAERIFERFYRSERTAKLAGGAGMGLAVCKRLIEAMNGRIWARSRSAGGLEVGFSLPPYEEMEP